VRIAHLTVRLTLICRVRIAHLTATNSLAK